jgi:hypothetical protein
MWLAFLCYNMGCNIVMPRSSSQLFIVQEHKYAIKVKSCDSNRKFKCSPGKGDTQNSASHIRFVIKDGISSLQVSSKVGKESPLTFTPCGGDSDLENTPHGENIPLSRPPLPRDGTDVFVNAYWYILFFACQEARSSRSLFVVLNVYSTHR